MIVAAAGRTFVVQSVISSAPLAALERDGGNGRLVSFLHGNRTAADNAGGDSGWGRGGSDELLGTQTGRDLGIPTSACNLSAHRGKRRTDVAGGIRSGRVIEAQKIWPVIEDMDHLPAPSTRRIAIYTSRPDSPLAANQLAAIQRYACAMGWVTVAIVESDEQRLLDLAATHALDLVLCWRTSDLRRAESLVQRLSVHSIELLAVAQSCTALME